MDQSGHFPGEVVLLGAVGGEVVEFGRVAARRAVSARIVNVFPIRRAHPADVGGVGKFLFVVVEIEPGFAPSGRLAGE